MPDVLSIPTPNDSLWAEEDRHKPWCVLRYEDGTVHGSDCACIQRSMMTPEQRAKMHQELMDAYLMELKAQQLERWRARLTR